MCLCRSRVVLLAGVVLIPLCPNQARFCNLGWCLLFSLSCHAFLTMTLCSFSFVAVAAHRGCRGEGHLECQACYQGDRAIHQAQGRGPHGGIARRKFPVAPATHAWSWTISCFWFGMGYGLFFVRSRCCWFMSNTVGGSRISQENPGTYVMVSSCHAEVQARCAAVLTAVVEVNSGTSFFLMNLR